MSLYEVATHYGVFEHLTSSLGGAVFISKPDIAVQLQGCNFKYCTASSRTSSSQRDDNNPSGGALFLDIKTANISQMYSSNCAAAGFGHVLYICCPSDMNCFISCLSDSCSGRYIEPCSIIYSIDKAKSDNSKINCTHPVGMRLAGAIHIGMEITEASLSYLNVVFDPLQSSDCAFGFGVIQETSPKCSYCNILNCEINSSY